MEKNSTTNLGGLPKSDRVALVHDWLNGMRGGERCLEVLCEIFPDAPIFTLFYEKGKLSPKISTHPIHPSRIDRWPQVYKRYRHYLPFFPHAIESMDFSSYDLVISTSHCVAKAAKKKKEALHICYCFTPMRYAWGFFDEYFGDQNFFLRALIREVIGRIQKWDLAVSSRVDHFVAISHHIRKRIQRAYDRSADVIYPPCDTDFYTPEPDRESEDFYLVVSALVPYKRIDLAIEAFGGTSRKLVIIGEGPERKKLESRAPKNVQFLGWQSDEVLRYSYRRARALIFPGEEDFGIVPVEAQACGCPVVALGEGGALETVVEGKTGLFFNEKTSDDLRLALDRFETMTWNPKEIREHALKFSRQRFTDEMKTYIESKLKVGLA